MVSYFSEPQGLLRKPDVETMALLQHLERCHFRQNHADRIKQAQIVQHACCPQVLALLDQFENTDARPSTQGKWQCSYELHPFLSWRLSSAAGLLALGLRAWGLGCRGLWEVLASTLSRCYASSKVVSRLFSGLSVNSETCAHVPLKQQGFSNSSVSKSKGTRSKPATEHTTPRNHAAHAYNVHITCP